MLLAKPVTALAKHALEERKADESDDAWGEALLVD